MDEGPHGNLIRMGGICRPRMLTWDLGAGHDQLLQAGSQNLGRPLQPIVVTMCRRRGCGSSECTHTGGESEGEGEGVQMAATNDSLWPPAGMQLPDHAPIIIDARRPCQ